MVPIKALTMNATKEEWIQLFVNPEKLSYIQQMGGTGEFKEHYIIGFELREYIMHKDCLKAIFEL
jgi:hypothetical protein